MKPKAVLQLQYKDSEELKEILLDLTKEVGDYLIISGMGGLLKVVSTGELHPSMNDCLKYVQIENNRRISIMHYQYFDSTLLYGRGQHLGIPLESYKITLFKNSEVFCQINFKND